MLSKPKVGDILKLYLVAFDHAINAVFTREEDEIQHPVYYASKALHNAKIRYSPVENLAYALVIASQKLWPYFLEHPVEVLTSSQQTLQKPDTSRRMVKWAVELGQFDIRYLPRTVVKGQALFDVVAEFSSER